MGVLIPHGSSVGVLIPREHEQSQRGLDWLSNECIIHPPSDSCPTTFPCVTSSPPNL